MQCLQVATTSGTHVGSSVVGSMSCLYATSRRIQGRYIRSSMSLLLNEGSMLFDVTTCMWLSTELAFCWQLSTLIRSLINVPGNKHVQQHTLGCRDWSANTRWMVGTCSTLVHNFTCKFARGGPEVRIFKCPMDRAAFLAICLIMLIAVYCDAVVSQLM